MWALKASAARRFREGEGTPAIVHRAGRRIPAPPPRSNANTMRYLEDFHEGQVFELGEETIREQEIVEFARRFDAQPFHVDAEAAKRSIYGGLIASGWHTASFFMGLLVRSLFHDVASMGAGLAGAGRSSSARWRRSIFSRSRSAARRARDPALHGITSATGRRSMSTGPCPISTRPSGARRRPAPFSTATYKRGNTAGSPIWRIRSATASASSRCAVAATTS